MHGFNFITVKYIQVYVLKHDLTVSLKLWNSHYFNLSRSMQVKRSLYNSEYGVIANSNWCLHEELQTYAIYANMIYTGYFGVNSIV